jgi:hypothetical protein
MPSVWSLFFRFSSDIKLIQLYRVAIIVHHSLLIWTGKQRRYLRITLLIPGLHGDAYTGLLITQLSTMYYRPFFLVFYLATKRL